MPKPKRRESRERDVSIGKRVQEMQNASDAAAAAPSRRREQDRRERRRDRPRQRPKRSYGVPTSKEKEKGKENHRASNPIEEHIKRARETNRVREMAHLTSLNGKCFFIYLFFFLFLVYSSDRRWSIVSYIFECQIGCTYRFL